MAAPADASLLAAELGGGEGGEEALRRLLQLPPDDDEERPPPSAPSRAVTPQPGLCVKTLAGGAKAFVNVCHAPEVPAPPPLPPPAALRRLLASPDAGAFRIPMSLGEPHAELDRGGRPCTAYDVVINSDFFHTLQADPLYLEFFLTVAMEGLAEKYGVELGQTGWRVLRQRRFLGTPGVQRIRARPRIQELDGPPPPPAAPPRPPRFVVVAQPSAQHPRVLQARVLLPHLAGAGSLSLGLSEERLVLGGPGGAGGGGGSAPPSPSPPLLALALPLPADPARCRARFHRRTKVLTVTIPLQV